MSLWRGRIVALLVLGVACRRGTIVSPASSQAASIPSPEPSVASGSPVRMEARNVDLHVAPGVVLSIRRLDGVVRSTQPGNPPIFDDRNSFLVEVRSGEIALSTESLTTLMNEHVFAYRKAPLADIEVAVKDGEIQQKGVLKKGIGIPFKAKGPLEVTSEGLIRIHPESIRAAHLPAKPFMKILGLKMEDLVEVQEGRGVKVHENDFLLDPEKLLPPPRMRGRVTQVWIEGDRVVQRFGEQKTGEKPWAPAGHPNYMYFQGGQLRFGKLTMNDTDLDLIDKDPRDPFDFDLDRYNDMLVAGYSKNTAAKGLRTFMPDYADLPQTAAHAAR